MPESYSFHLNVAKTHGSQEIAGCIAPRNLSLVIPVQHFELVNMRCPGLTSG